MWDFADFPGTFPVEVVEVVPNEKIVLRWEANEGVTETGAPEDATVVPPVIRLSWVELFLGTFAGGGEEASGGAGAVEAPDAGTTGVRNKARPARRPSLRDVLRRTLGRVGDLVKSRLR